MSSEQKRGVVMQNGKATRGRGATANPAGRFERLETTRWDEEDGPKTEIFFETAKGIIATIDSPDVGFEASVNPYRGCEHGCIYCFARPTHEYMGLSAGMDFETKIFAKTNAPELLRKALMSPGWKPQPIGMSGVTDPYQPVERELQITRRCLEVLAEFRQPVVIITKNQLVTRDVDLLAQLAEHQAVKVNISITTLDGELARRMEPRTSQPRLRLQAVRTLREAGVPVGVLMAPIIPGLTDHEIPSLLEEVAAAGAEWAGYTMLRLPHGVKDLFGDWLEAHFPDRKQKVLNRMRDIRGGKLYDADYATRMVGQGVFADAVATLFEQSRRRFGLDQRRHTLSSAAFRRPSAQASLFD